MEANAPCTGCPAGSPFGVWERLARLFPLNNPICFAGIQKQTWRPHAASSLLLSPRSAGWRLPPPHRTGLRQVERAFNVLIALPAPCAALQQMQRRQHAAAACCWPPCSCPPGLCFIRQPVMASVVDARLCCSRFPALCLCHPAAPAHARTSGTCSWHAHRWAAGGGWCGCSRPDSHLAAKAGPAAPRHRSRAAARRARQRAAAAARAATAFQARRGLPCVVQHLVRAVRQLPTPAARLCAGAC